MTAARFSAKGSKVAPIATPKVSMTCRFACLKTSAGISSDVVCVTKLTIASVVPIDDSPQFPVLIHQNSWNFVGSQRIEQLLFCNIGLIEDADQAKNDRKGMGTKNFLVRCLWLRFAGFVGNHSSLLSAGLPIS